MKIHLSQKDILWSYIGTVLSMAANLLMLPFLVYYLDEDMLGLWYVFASIGAIAVLFDFGFSVTFARNITYCWSGAGTLKKEDVEFSTNAEPDYRLMKQVLSTCKLIYFLISSVALLLLLTAGTVYIGYISRGIAGYQHYIAWFLYAIAVYLNLYYGYFAAFLRGVGAVDAANKNTVIARVAQIIVMAALLAAGTGIIGASAAYLVYGTLFRMLGKYKFYRYQNLGEHLRAVTEKATLQQIKTMFATVWHNAWRDGAISLCNYFCNQASTLICSAYLTLAETGVYSIGVQIASAIAQIAGTLYTAYQPELQSAYINQDKAKMRRTMSMIVVVYVLLFVLGTVGVIVVGLPLLRIIKPETIVSVPVLLGLCLYQFILKFRNCYTSYFSCTNRIVYLNGFLVSAVVCVVLSFVMIGPLGWGIFGLILAQIISQAVYNLWVWPIKAHRELGLSVAQMLRLGLDEIGKMLQACVQKLKH